MNTHAGTKSLILEKLKSHLLGEFIATAIANILRNNLVSDVLANYPQCVRHDGYVDDTLPLLASTKEDLECFVSAMSIVIHPLSGNMTSAPLPGVLLTSMYM